MSVIARGIDRTLLAILRFLFRNEAVPMARLAKTPLIREMRRRLAHSQSLTAGKALDNRFLSDAFADMSLGAWSLGARTLNLLERHIRLQKPELILEFGSGISTCCLARYMQDLYSIRDRTFVYSFEQDERFAVETVRLLGNLGLERTAVVSVAPVIAQEIRGESTTCYSQDNVLETLPNNAKAQMVVIDGPAGDSGVRWGTLPMVLPVLDRGAWFFLDDGLRDGELKIAQRWATLSGIRLDGVFLVDKGLLVGQME